MPEEFLDNLVVMQAEALGFEDAENAYATEKLQQVYTKFETAVYEALENYDFDDLLNGDFTFLDLYHDDGPFQVLMTLNGEGVGIWDGSWDHYFRDPKDIKALQTYLGEVLLGWAESTGTGKLNDAIETAVFDSLEAG